VEWQTRRVPVTRPKPDGYGYGYKFLPAGTDMGTNFYPQPLCWRTGNCSTRPEPDPLPSLGVDSGSFLHLGVEPNKNSKSGKKIWNKKIPKNEPKKTHLQNPPFRCQISPMRTNTSVKFNPRIFFYRSGFRLIRHNLLPSLPRRWMWTESPKDSSMKETKVNSTVSSFKYLYTFFY
jgi:hypothetical protein